MAALPSDLRRQLENVCIKARDAAEAGARSALMHWAVDAPEPFAHFTADQKRRRNRLRARGRQLGDLRLPNRKQALDHLTQELAYEYWHRMLFARFLADNNLLVNPDGVAVSLEECAELARSEGAPNGFILAARYASRMLPEIFRTDDVLLEIPFAPEQRIALEKLLASLPRETFVADDSLGWVYQFWQTKRKEEVNKSGDKIDAETLPVVTQLFTEPYMVQFLLHNTIGAWAVGQAFQPDGSGVRLESLTYLRRREDGTPAAGTFPGWPKTLREFTMLDPCCGSGHFLVSAFHLLVPLRMQAEGLSAREAADAVLRDNLFGLEIDPRCTQIAAFALALAAWKYSGENGEPLGYRRLPSLNLACTGIAPRATEEQWLHLADQALQANSGSDRTSRRFAVLGREPIRNGLAHLHALFSEAPFAGSLIDPSRMSADLVTADYETLKPYLDAALTAEQANDDVHERAVAAAGMVKAAELLTRGYTLVATNVPYLGRSKQHETLKEYCEKKYADAKADLATCFVERCLSFCAMGGSAALVTPQNWLFLGTYKKLRRRLLASVEWDFVIRLGANAFQDMNWWAANTVLSVFTDRDPCSSHVCSTIDASYAKHPEDKPAALRSGPVQQIRQQAQSENPDYRITVQQIANGALLSGLASYGKGSTTGDRPRFLRSFWEIPQLSERNRVWLDSPKVPAPWAGRELVTTVPLDAEELLEQFGCRIHGQDVWDRPGIALNKMNRLQPFLYSGEVFDDNVGVIAPSDRALIPAILCYCESPQYGEAIRAIDQALKVTAATLVKVPFDRALWQETAAEMYPDGLPPPYSSDPTQWLFEGHPSGSDDPLQVAVARLLGYRWPRQTGSSFPDCPALDPDGLEPFAAREGIVCLPAVRGEPPAAERLLELVQAAYGKNWSNGLLNDLLNRAGCKAGVTLDDWLRNAFFEQHCKRFHQRPFIWHIWDGRKDGFACLVNYHRLDRVRLESLTYAYLGDWIKVQAADAKAGKTAADLRLAASQALQEKLKLILTGEPPYDIFVRWKPLSEQAIGWNPDLNDGVRMNIRPFVEAGILRKPPNIKWTKDRGKEPERDREAYPWFWKGKEFVGDRVNDVHLTNAEKQAARR